MGYLTLNQSCPMLSTRLLFSTLTLIVLAAGSGCVGDDEVFTPVVPILDPDQACDESTLVRGWAGSSVAHGGTVLGMDATDASFGVAVGSGGDWWLTDDAGESWTARRLTVDGRVAGDLGAVCFPTRETGYVLPAEQAATPYFYQTTDGGTNWTKQAQPDLAELTTLHFFDATRGLAIGRPTAIAEQRLLRTTDGGRTWTIVQDPVVRTLRSAFFDGPDGSLVIDGTDADNNGALFALFADGNYQQWTHPSSSFLSHLSALPDGTLRARFDVVNNASFFFGGLRFVSTDGGDSWLSTDVFQQNAAATAGHWRTATDGFYLIHTRNLQGTTGQVNTVDGAPYEVEQFSGGTQERRPQPPACAFEGPAVSFGTEVFVQARAANFLRLAYE